MARKIKKITKRATVSIFWLGIFVLSILTKLFFGGSSANLSRIESSAKDVLGDIGNTSVARADAPDLCSSCACADGGAAASGDGGAAAAAAAGTGGCSSTSDGGSGGDG